MLSQAFWHFASISKGAVNETKLLIINIVRVKPAKTKPCSLKQIKKTDNKMTEIIQETLKRIIVFRDNYISDEQAVRTQLIEPILNEMAGKLLIRNM